MQPVLLTIAEKIKMLLPQAGSGYLLLALLCAVQVRADQLNCNDSAWATDKMVIDLGKLNEKPLRLTVCTDSRELVLGRAYLKSQDKSGKRQIQELPNFGGCGAGALHAMRADDEILVTQRTCQSRDYHPVPYWNIAVL